jgi:NADH:ubiquinone oxidoreductase subunit 2 (subunit N)
MNKLQKIFFGEYIFILPDIFFIFSILFLLCFSLYFSSIIRSLKISQLIIDLSVPILILLLILCYIFFDLDVIILLNFKIDNFFIFCKLIFIFFLLICVYTSRYYFYLNKMYIYEYIFILLLSVQGGFLIMMSYDLFIIYLALELQNLCFYVLASMRRYSSFSTEAGLKYFILGAFSSSLFLFGVSLIYGLFGSLNLFDIILFIKNDYIYSFVLFISLFFILSGLIFKLGGAPFH